MNIYGRNMNIECRDMNIMQSTNIWNRISLSHEDQNPPFLGYCLPSWKILDTSNNVHEKRLLKVVTVNLL
jgi:hypothetical protein